MKKVNIKVLRGNKQQIERELVLKMGKVYIPKNKELRAEIIQLYYDVPVAGHREKWKMMELVTRNYWQLEVIKDVE